jgi:hypothetical protein
MINNYYLDLINYLVAFSSIGLSFFVINNCNIIYNTYFRI